MQDESGTPLRAWVDYYRDLGIHDFYRRGEPVIAGAEQVEEAANETAARFAVKSRDSSF